MPQYNAFIAEQQQDVKDEMSVFFEDKVRDLMNLYIGDAIVPGLLEELLDLNDRYVKYTSDIESGGYEG